MAGTEVFDKKRKNYFLITFLIFAIRSTGTGVAAFRIPSKYRQYPALVPVIGAFSCLGLIGFLTINSWIIGIIGLALGIVWYFIQHRISR
jgi:hypothetical protein